ncbi:hypothetical protein Fot_10927 [Forsythia ovata]|uniref:Uncharacterized protein n=1 Tax=Forsythia ovata TaxID=205694 RepID=A0ABD1WIG9_9LAMI
MDPSQYDVTIQYQVLSNGPLIKVCSDSSVYIYIQVKNVDLELTKLPLFVDIKKVACDEVNLMFLDTLHLDPSFFKKRQTMVNRNCTDQWLDNALNLRLPTVEEMGFEISKNVLCLDEVLEETESEVVCQPSIGSVK